MSIPETAEAMQAASTTVGMLADKNFAVALTMMVGPSVAAIGIAWIGATSTSAIARNPEAAAKVQTAMILTAAFTEAIAIYCLVVALILKFV